MPHFFLYAIYLSQNNYEFLAHFHGMKATNERIDPLLSVCVCVLFFFFSLSLSLLIFIYPCSVCWKTHTHEPCLMIKWWHVTAIFNTNQSENLPVASIMNIKSRWLFHKLLSKIFWLITFLKSSIIFIQRIQTKQYETEITVLHSEYECRGDRLPGGGKELSFIFIFFFHRIGYVIDLERLDGALVHL